MLASKNIRPAIRTLEEGLPWLRLLSGELYCRLQEAQTSSEGLWPKTISLKFRLEEFAWWDFGAWLSSPAMCKWKGAHHLDPLNPISPLEQSVQASFPQKRVLRPEDIEEAAKSLWSGLHRRLEGGPAEVHNVSWASPSSHIPDDSFP